MNSKLSGKVLKYGDNIDTDMIISGLYTGSVKTHSDPTELSKHAMEALDPKFPEKVKQAPILVAGRNFGCGSSREEAPLVLKECGVSVILAESFGRIFFRNAINFGLPVIECEDISSKVSEGDQLEVDLKTGEIANISTEEELHGQKLPDFILEIMSYGGLTPYRISKLKELNK